MNGQQKNIIQDGIDTFPQGAQSSQYTEHKIYHCCHFCVLTVLCNHYHFLVPEPFRISMLSYPDFSASVFFLTFTYIQ